MAFMFCILLVETGKKMGRVSVPLFICGIQEIASFQGRRRRLSFISPSRALTARVRRRPFS